MKLIIMVLMILIPSTISGCANTGNFCDVASPIRGEKTDTNISEKLKRSIVAHNLIGVKLCSWKP